MRRKVTARITAIVLAIVLVLGMVPADTLAAVSRQDTATSSEQKTDAKVYVTNEKGEKLLYSDSGKKAVAVTEQMRAASYNIWDTFEYGSYPQTRETSSSIISALNQIQQTNVQGYYEYNKKKYAKVNGSYYLVEPIVWRVVADYGNGSMLIMSDKVLDSRPFNDTSSNLTWESSTLRSWLNDTFYRTAFHSGERGAIHQVEVDNSASTSFFDYQQNNTKDRIYLFSYADLTNATYNFSENSQDDDPQRRSESTQYAQAMGAGSGYCNYWTRSSNESTVQYVLAGDGCVGTCHSPASANSSGYGVRPIITVDSTSSYYHNSNSKIGGSVTLTLHNLDRSNNDQNYTEILKQKDVEITGSGATQTEKTDDAGMCELTLPEGELITIHVDGYYDYKFYRKVITGSTADIYLTPMKETQKPYVSSVFYQKTNDVKWSNGATQSLTVGQDDTDTYDIDMTGVWRDHSEGTYVLAQDGAHKITSQDGHFTGINLAKVFVPEEPVYAYMTSSDGSVSDAYSVKISVTDKTVEKLANGTFKLLGSNGLTYTLPDEIMLVGGSEIGLNFPSFPLSVEKSGNTYKVSIGIEIFSKSSSTKDKNKVKKEEDDYNILKENLKKLDMVQGYKDDKKKRREAKNYYTHLNILRKNLKQSTKNGKIFGSGSVDVNLYGYAEFSIVNGKPVMKEGCGYLTVGGEYNWTQMYLIGPVPFYTEIGVGVDAEARGGVERIVPDASIPLELSMKLKVTPHASMELGVGVPKWINAGVNGKAEAPISYELMRKYLQIDFTMSASIKANCWLLKYDKEIASKTWNIVSKTFGTEKAGNHRAQSGSGGIQTADASLNALYQESSYRKLADRNYSEQASWAGSKKKNSNIRAAAKAGGNTVKKLDLSTYENAQPQIVETNGTRMMVWLRDDTDRASEDRTQLVYSIYQASDDSWSAPQPVDALDADSSADGAGTADFYPSVAVCGRDIYIVWQNTKKKLAGTENLELSDYAKNGEIRVAKYDTTAKTMSDAVDVTDNDTLDSVPTAVEQNGTLSVVWINNDANDSFGTSGNNTIMTCQVGENLTVSEAQAVQKKVNSVQKMDAFYQDGKLYVVTAEDQDNDFTDLSDVEIIQYVMSGSETEKTKLTDNSVEDCSPQIAQVGNTAKLFWYADGSLYGKTLGSSAAAQKVWSDTYMGSDDYQVVTNGNTSYIVWSGLADEHAELYASTYKDGAFTTPVTLTDEKQKMLHPSALCDASGNLIVAFDYVNQEKQSSILDEETGETFEYWQDQAHNLSTLTVSGQPDLVLDDSELIISEEEVEPGKEVTLKLGVRNNGGDTTGYEVKIDGETAYTSDQGLTSGASETIQVPYTFPKEITNTTLKIQVEPKDAQDAKEDDNTAEVSYGYANLQIASGEVQELPGAKVLSFTVENRSYIKSNNYALEVHEKNADGDILTEVGAEALEGQHYTSLSVKIPDSNLEMKSGESKELYVLLRDEKTGEALSYTGIQIQPESFQGVTASILQQDSSDDGVSVSGILENHSGDDMQGYLTFQKADGTTLSRQFIDVAAYEQNNFTKTFAGVSADEKISVTFKGTKKLYDFAETEDGNIKINAYYGEESSLEIPSEIAGKKVTELANNLFSNHSELKQVTLPDGITVIGLGAFRNTGITALEIGKNVTTIGNNAFRGCGSLKSLTIDPQNKSYRVVKNVLYNTDATRLIYASAGADADFEVPDSVTVIAENAFSDHGKLTSVTFHENLKEIEKLAFQGCQKLEAVTLPDSLTKIGSYAFSDCTGLKKADTGNGLTQLPGGIFKNAVNLEEVTLGRSLTSIANGAFYDVNHLNKIQFNSTNMKDLSSQQKIFYRAGSKSETLTVSFGEGVTRIPAYFFYGSEDYKISVTSADFGGNDLTVGDYAFRENEKLTEITGAQGVSGVGNYAFYQCSALKKMEGISSLDKVGVYAFYNDRNLEMSLDLSALTDVPEYAFYENEKLNITGWSDKLESIGANAFAYNYLLKEIRLPDTLKSIGDAAFYYDRYVTTLQVDCENVKLGSNVFYYMGNYSNDGLQVFFGEHVTKIPDNLFYGQNMNLKTIEIPDQITRIGNNAFRNSSISNVTGMNQVKEIGSCAFAGCGNLQSLSFPAALESVEDYAFYNDYNLKTLEFHDYEGELSSTAFSGCSALATITGAKNYNCEDGIVYNEDKTELLTVLNNANDKLETLEVPDTVEIIRADAFYNNSYIKKVILPDSVQIIEENAFRSCGNLTSVDMGKGVSSLGTAAFRDCTQLKNLKLSPQLKRIGNSAFYNCGNLKTVDIPDSVERIEENAFGGCGGITSLTLGAHVKEIQAQAFQNCSSLKELTIPDSVEIIGSRAFDSMNSLQTLTIGTGVKSIESSAFAYARKLKQLNFNAVSCADLTDGGSAFYYAGYDSKDLHVAFGDQVTRIPGYFSRTSTGSDKPWLTEVTFGASVREIGPYAFYYQKKFDWNKVNLENVEIIGDYAFACDNLTSLNLKKVIQIGDSAFSNVTTLTGEITFPDTLESIGKNAFYYDTAITAIDTGDSLQSIGEQAFYQNTALTDIRIGDAVTSVGRYAFYSCPEVQTLTLGENLETIGEQAFYNMPKLGTLNYRSIRIEDQTSDRQIFYKLGMNNENGVVMNVGEKVTYIPAYLMYPRYGSSSNGVNLKTVNLNAAEVTIGNYAFANMSNLTNVNIKDGSVIVRVGSSAFYQCQKLTGFDFSKIRDGIGEYAFYYCLALKQVKLADTISEIGRYTFYNNQALEIVDIGNGVTEIGEYAFDNCSGLKELTLGESLKKVGYQSFRYSNALEVLNYNAIRADDRTSDSSAQMFYNMGSSGNGITINVGEKVERIPAYMMYSGYSSYRNYVKAINFQTPNVEIGEYAFYNQSTLETMNAEPLAKVERYAFYGCSQLAGELNFTNLTELGEQAFRQDSKITSVNFGDNLKAVPSYAFDNCQSIGQIHLGKQVEEIGEGAFQNNIALRTLICDNSLKTIGQYAFKGCTALSQLRLNEGLKNVGYQAFNSCTGMASVTVPDSVTAFGDYCLGYRSYSRYTPFTIYASAGSAAETWAKNHSITFVATGTTALEPESVEIADGSELTLYVGDTQTLTALISPQEANAAVQWSSSASDVVSVDANGTLSAKKAGEAQITATVAEGITATCNVTVADKTDLSKAEIRTDEFAEYTGKPVQVNVNVYLDSRRLAAGDYTIEYKNNTQIGTATVTITGTGAYCGTKSADFTIRCLHKNMTTEVTKAATCTEAGSQTLTCTLCGYETSQEIPQLSHEEGSWQTDVEPDYNKAGHRFTACRNCGEIMREEELPALTDTNAPTGTISIGLNSWDKFLSAITFGIYRADAQEIRISASDSESGVEQIQYLISNHELTVAELEDSTEWKTYTEPVSIPAADVTYAVVYAKMTDKCGNATLINSDGICLDGSAPVVTGVTEGAELCVSADITVSDATLQYVAIDGKEQKLDDTYTVNKKGSHVIVAQDKVGHTTTVTFTILGSHVSGDWIVDREATEEQKGERHLECKRCGEEVYREEIEYSKKHTEHQYQMIEEVAATCTTDGYRIYRCSECEAQYQETIPAAGHDYEVRKVPATTTQKGYTLHTCSKCNDSYRDEETALKPMTVTFHPNGGQVSAKNKSVTYQSAYGTLPTAKRKGYLLAGWYTKASGGTKISAATKVLAAKNHTIYAHWSKVSVAKAAITKVTPGKAQAVVQWKKVSGAAGYQIRYSLKSNFKAAKTVTTKTTKVTLKKLTSKKTWYFQVRAYKTDSTGAKVYGAWSTKKSAKIK